MFDEARDRLAGAERLIDAIEACDPDYAGIIMLQALEAMFHGAPCPPLDDLDREMRFWAGITCTAELVVLVRACAGEIGGRIEDRVIRIDLAARLMAGLSDRNWRAAYRAARSGRSPALADEPDR
ncbi:hypothetical protein [Rhodovulum strictum]|uniref:Uncharacterized protein n=1 Tax=Rhodovulum strictum TaxID=58314 RepID=A0A844B916_9RHOB|nr:hypothetical protein [Rhodovulum strictum]MRH22876.1 hypothetical protein [Rhodovulum strictum]